MTISPPSSHGVAFPDTHWSALSTAREGDSAASRRVIDHLCATYWKPIHTYIRYLGQGDQDAEDLTQEFFRQLMVRGNLFLQARRERGKLRSYVCVAVKRLVIDAARKKGSSAVAGMRSSRYLRMVTFPILGLVILCPQTSSSIASGRGHWSTGH